MVLILVLKPLEEMGNLKKKKSALWSRLPTNPESYRTEERTESGGEQQAAEDAIH